MVNLKVENVSSFLVMSILFGHTGLSGGNKLGYSLVFCPAESEPAARRKCCIVFLFFRKTKQKQAECREEKVFVDSRAAQSG